MSSLNAEDVRKEFNASSQKVRVVALLSPTYPDCQSGHGVVGRVLKKFPSPQLKAILVWEPMRDGDNASSARQQAETVQDIRISQRWDGGQNLGCFPTIALVAGLSLATLRPWIWIPAFLIMGVGCLVNASRCGRLHCYITGPIFLLAAIYVGLSTMSIVPIRPGIFLFTVLAIAMLACLAELPLGRYKRSA